MQRRTLSFTVLVLSILYGAGFAIFRGQQAYAILDAAIVAIAWISVGYFGRDTPDGPLTGGVSRHRNHGHLLFGHW